MNDSNQQRKEQSLCTGTLGGGMRFTMKKELIKQSANVTIDPFDPFIDFAETRVYAPKKASDCDTKRL